jgi:hypothetical protein
VSTLYCKKVSAAALLDFQEHGAILESIIPRFALVQEFIQLMLKVLLKLIYGTGRSHRTKTTGMYRLRKAA